MEAIWTGRGPLLPPRDEQTAPAVTERTYCRPCFTRWHGRNR